VRFEELAANVLMFVGDDHESVATAFIDGDDALLVDSLGCVEDALWLRRVLCDDMGKSLRVIAATHFMCDHMAGLPMTLRWGQHQLNFVHNPGKTMDHVSVDVPTADLLCAGDNIVGNIVYLSKADPLAIRAAIGRMRQFGRSIVIGGHIGRFPADALDNAAHYLDRLREAVIDVRATASAAEADERIGSIRIESCLAPRVEPTAFEREWHQNNLQVIVAQSVFAFDAAIASREARA
jgi:cyclase